MSEEILQPNMPVKFPARNMRPSFKRLKAGDIFLVQVEVEESVWNSLRTVPDNALWENVAWWHDGDTPASETVTVPEEPTEPKKEKPAKAEKGLYGQYWYAMHRPDGYGANFTTFPDWQQVLDVDADHVHEALKIKMNVESLTFVSPRQFEAFVTEQGMHEGLISLSKRCEVWAMENPAKQLGDRNG